MFYVQFFFHQGAKVWLSNNASQGLFALATSSAADKNGPVASASDKKTVSQPICAVTPVALAKAVKNEQVFETLVGDFSGNFL
jgi:hypothetical protein